MGTGGRLRQKWESMWYFNPPPPPFPPINSSNLSEFTLVPRGEEKSSQVCVGKGKLGGIGKGLVLLFYRLFLVALDTQHFPKVGCSGNKTGGTPRCYG